MTGVEYLEQYIKSDSSRISKVEPLPNWESLQILGDFYFLGWCFMGVKIEGINCLNSGLYEKLIILENEANKSYQVRAKGKDEQIQTWIPESTKRFTDSIKALPDNEKIEQIIHYYLENHKIVAFQKQQIIPYYQNLFTIMKSEESFLALKLFCEKKILWDCIIKYQKDRDKFLESKKDISYYEVCTSEQESSYREYALVDESMVCLYLLKEAGNLLSWDKKFLTQWVLRKLQEQGEKAEVIKPYPCFHNCEDHVTSYPKLICGNLVIDLKENLLRHTIRQVVEEYNHSLETQKVLGFKKERF